MVIFFQYLTKGVVAMPRKKVLTTVTPAEARRTTLVKKSLANFFMSFQELGLSKEEEHLAGLICLRDQFLVGRLSELVPPRKRLQFIRESEQVLFKNNQGWLKEVVTVLYEELKGKL